MGSALLYVIHWVWVGPFDTLVPFYSIIFSEVLFAVDFGEVSREVGFGISLLVVVFYNFTLTILLPSKPLSMISLMHAL